VILIKIKVNRSNVIFVVLITALFAFTLTMIILNFRNDKKEFYIDKIDHYKSHIDSSLESYSLFSLYIFESIIEEDDYILSLIDEAYTADTATQEVLRSDLYDYLVDEYEDMIEFDFRQFHFHFPDSTSFLRMHKPEAFGDSLLNIRYSIKTVNELQTAVSGFEEGRIFNGYRYVYPLSYNDNHIGSVEISVSMSSVINLLTSVYGSDYSFIISKNIVDQSVFEEELDNYSVSYLSNDFYTDDGCFSDVNERNHIPQEEWEAFYNTINDNDLNSLLDFDNFGFATKYNDKNYELLFSVVENIEGVRVGYFISVNEEAGIINIEKTFNTAIISLIVIYIFSLVMGILFLKNRRILKSLSNTDRLTGLDNRRKFESDLNKELSRSKRNNIQLSFIMFDIDFFKRINDEYGHSIGDVVLKELSDIVKASIRKEDSISRHGGEEFIVMLVGANGIVAQNKAESIRKLVEDFNFSFEGKVTISLGVYECVLDDDTYEDIIKYVDIAMYAAKVGGRNTVRNFSNIMKP